MVSITIDTIEQINGGIDVSLINGRKARITQSLDRTIVKGVDLKLLQNKLDIILQILTSLIERIKQLIGRIYLLVW